MPFGWAILGSAVIGAAGSTIAAGEQASGQEAAANTQAGMFNTIQGQEQPYMTAGNQATTALNQLLGTSGTPGSTVTGTGLPQGYLTQQFNPTMQSLEQYPGYQFALSQGDQAVTNASTPGQGALSGPTLKSLMNYNQGLASTQYQNAFSNFQTQQNNIFDRLSQIATLGQNAASNTGTAGSQLGTGIAQAQAAAAGSQAAGIIGATNSISGSSIPLAYLLGGQGTAGIGATADAYGASAPTLASAQLGYSP